MVKRGSSLLETRRWNRVLIKKMIFRTENVTRTEIAELQNGGVFDPEKSIKSRRNARCFQTKTKLIDIVSI